jgi:NitT/TauT family transport system substrate-binding protein
MSVISRRDFLRLGAGTLLWGAALSLGLGACAPRREKGGGGARPRGKTLKIAYLPITDHLTIIALGRIKFAEAEWQPIKFASWPELAEALKAGAVEAAFALTPISLALRQQGVPIKAVLLGHRNGSVLTVKAGEAINTVGDLRGKRIAIPSKFSTHHILIRKILADRGIDPSEVELFDMAPPEMVQALASGQIDGFIVAEPFGAQAELQGVGRVLILSKDIWPNHICCILNVRENLLADNPEAVQELVNGLVETGQFIEANRKQAAQLSKDYLGQKPEVIEYVLNNPKDRVTFSNLYPAREDFAATQRYMRLFGIEENTVDLDAYVDDRFARVAYRL